MRLAVAGPLLRHQGSRHHDRIALVQTGQSINRQSPESLDCQPGGGFSFPYPSRSIVIGRGRAQPEGADRRGAPGCPRRAGWVPIKPKTVVFISLMDISEPLCRWYESDAVNLPADYSLHSSEAVPRRIPSQSADNRSGGRDWPRPGTLRRTVTPSCLRTGSVHPTRRALWSNGLGLFAWWTTLPTTGLAMALSLRKDIEHRSWATL